MPSLSGRCLCGEVRFTVSTPPLFVAHCHCRWCREAHGAAFVTWVGFREEAVVPDREDQPLSWYESSGQSRRGFCTRCGTTLFFRSTLCPGEQHVVRTAFADDAPLPLPKLHCFDDQRAPWLAGFAALPRYGSDEPGLAKYRKVPPRER